MKAQPARVIDSPYLNMGEVIQFLRLEELDAPQAAIYRLVKQHGLPHRRRGGLYLFDKREVDAWTQGHASAIELLRSRRSA